MSFDIFLQSYWNGDAYQFPSSIVRERFARYIRQDDGRVLGLEFDVGYSFSYLYTDEGPLSDGFSINRPAENIELWRIIASFLRDFPCVLQWPGPKGSRPLIVGSLDTIPHLPRIYIEGLGVPIVSTDPEFIRSYVGDNS